MSMGANILDCNLCLYHAYLEKKIFLVTLLLNCHLYCPWGWICKIDMFAHWEETLITGLTTEPIYLYSCSSGCYTAGHHNWCKNFYFEPMFEGISQSIVDELWLMNVKGIELHNINCSGSPGIRYHDFDGQVFNEKPYLGDFDHDGDVDFADLQEMAQYWLDDNCGLCRKVDLSCDDKVNMEDFARFAENWLAGL